MPSSSQFFLYAWTTTLPLVVIAFSFIHNNTMVWPDWSILLVNINLLLFWRLCDFYEEVCRNYLFLFNCHRCSHWGEGCVRSYWFHIDYCTDFIVFFIVKCPYSKAAIEGLIFVFRICEMSIPYFEFFSQRRANYCKFSFCTN